MKFEKILKKYLIEVEKNQEIFPQPWSLEITKDLNKSEEYNLLGELIIQLSILRSKIK